MPPWPPSVIAEGWGSDDLEPAGHDQAGSCRGSPKPPNVRGRARIDRCNVAG